MMGDEMEVLGDLAGDQERLDTSVAAQALFFLAAVDVEPLCLLARCLYFSEVSLTFECESYR
jgi:hypothetical protein